jgi:hypothetical protein
MRFGVRAQWGSRPLRELGVRRQLPGPGGIRRLRLGKSDLHSSTAPDGLPANVLPYAPNMRPNLVGDRILIINVCVEKIC